MYYVIADKLVRRDCPPQRLLLAIIQRLCDLAGITYRPEGLQMGEFSVTPMQFAALAKLHDAGRVSQIELGRSTAMDPATVWGVVNRLAKQGYVAQSPAPSDGRLVMVELTDADVLWYGIDRTNREIALPAEEPSRKLRDLQQAMQTYRAQHTGLLQYVRTTSDDLRRRLVDRQQCDAYQWALLISTHEQRHILQIREIKANPKFPRPER